MNLCEEFESESEVNAHDAHKLHIVELIVKILLFLTNIAELDDACGTQPNQRACNGLAFAICAPTDKCECITGFEEYEGVCSCAEGDTLAEDEKSCQDGTYLIIATVA